MNGIIFAAGRSSRLGSLTNELPKICLEIEEGKTILDRALTSLAENGIKNLTIVTGHAEEKIRQATKAYEGKFDSIKFIYNDLFLERNNIYTAYLIRHQINSDTLIFNSDIVYDPEILRLAVKKAESSTKSFLVVDDQKKLVDEDMKVLLDKNGQILRINKELDNEACTGEYIGILRLAGSDITKFNASLEKMIADEEYSKYYEDALDRITAELDLELVLTKGLLWTEIDTPVDYERAKGIIAKLKNLFKNSSDARLASPEQAELTDASMMTAKDEYNAADENFRTGSHA